MKKIKLIIITIIIILNSTILIADDFNNWKIKFKKRAIKEGISKKTVDNLIDNSKFLIFSSSELSIAIVRGNLIDVLI